MFSRLKKAKATFSSLREVRKRGGPQRVRVRGVEQPEGKVLTTSTAHIEVDTRDGGQVRIDPEFPVPFFFAWGYRLARKLGVPLIRSFEPERVEVGMTVPGWAWPGGRG